MVVEVVIGSRMELASSTRVSTSLGEVVVVSEEKEESFDEELLEEEDDELLEEEDDELLEEEDDDELDEEVEAL
jgi:hypothetical protein